MVVRIVYTTQKTLYNISRGVPPCPYLRVPLLMSVTCDRPATVRGRFYRFTPFFPLGRFYRGRFFLVDIFFRGRFFP